MKVCCSKGNEKQWGRSDAARQPFISHLLSTHCVLGSVLGFRDAAVKENKDPTLKGVYTLVGGEIRQ